MGKPPCGNIDIMVKKGIKIKGKKDLFTWDRKGRKQALGLPTVMSQRNS
jgi:hypothetical protein